MRTEDKQVKDGTGNSLGANLVLDCIVNII